MIRRSGRKNKIIALILTGSMLLGCGQVTGDGRDEEIPLEEPVGIAANYDEARIRDLYDVDVFSSTVVPYVEEYAFVRDQNFKKYGVLPGEEVSKGETLVYAETREIDKQIRDIDESLRDLEENHALELTNLNKDLTDAKKAEYEAHQDVAKMYEMEPPAEAESAHRGWESLTMMPDSAYKRAKQSRERVEQSIKENTELYELERRRLEDTKKLADAKIDNASVMSGMDGTVVNCTSVYGGEKIEKDLPLIAVGDMSVKLIRTDYLSKGTVNKAEDIFAVINGIRYEVTYDVMEPEEYNILKNNGETVYTTFFINEGDYPVSYGDHAALVLIRESRRDVLCIPQDAIKKENNISYVYVFDGTESIYTPIETGMKDGNYIEVLSGLKEGDKVLSQQAVVKGKNTAVLAMGDCSTPMEVSGFFYYPFSEWIVSPMEEGTAYIKEILVTDNETVEEGQTLATIEVIADSVEIERCRKRLERLQTRLDKELAVKYDHDARKIIDRENEKTISAYQKEITDLNRRLNKLQKYSGVIAIKAPARGIVVDKGYLKEGDLIYPDTKIMRFSNDSASYLIVRDDKAVLNYGNQAEIAYVDAASQRKLAGGTVVTVSNSSLSGKMAKDWALVKIDEADSEAVSGNVQGAEGRWDRNSFKVSVETRLMKNVLLVPKAAVTIKGGTTYVEVLEEDGSVYLKSFIAGGSNNNFYWVVSGLDKGMNICWE